MPLGEIGGWERSESRYCGVETDFSDDIPSLLSFHISTGGFDYVLAPLMNPSNWPSLVEGNGSDTQVLPVSGSDLVLAPSQWSSHFIGSRERIHRRVIDCFLGEKKTKKRSSLNLFIGVSPGLWGRLVPDKELNSSALESLLDAGRLVLDNAFNSSVVESLLDAGVLDHKYHEEVRAMWLAEKGGQVYKHPYDISAYENLTFSDGVPKEGLRIKDVLVRIAVLMLVQEKVKLVEDHPAKDVFPNRILETLKILKSCLPHAIRLQSERGFEKWGMWNTLS